MPRLCYERRLLSGAPLKRATKTEFRWIFAWAVASVAVGCDCSNSGNLVNCPASCPVGQACFNGACAPGCRSSNDCPASDTCVGGICLLSCTGNEDCASGEQCVGEVCMPGDGGTLGVDGGHDGGAPLDAGHLDSGHLDDAGQSDGGSGLDGGICPSAAQLIYVIDVNGTLSSFDPSNQTFNDVGKPDCPAHSGLAPFSMAVDRQGYAWILYGAPGATNTQVFKVDTLNLSCATTGFAPTSDFATFGMGYVKDGGSDGGEQDDTLFIASTLSATGWYNFGTLNTGTGQSALLASQSSNLGSPELTGTSASKLFGFFPGWCDSSDDTPWPAYVLQVNPSTGATVGSGNDVSDVYSGGDSCSSPIVDYAFAAYGGNFWLFTKSQNDSATQVRELTASGNVNFVLDTGTRNILGAGVSTCVPAQ
jgi:hypothetical protein